ncbi:MAG TPA: SAM-dependent methyltransferase [Phycisphaerae bacterium]|nr:SAM-dependent methyltransferase [Phycisphaerae bacterium]
MAFTLKDVVPWGRSFDEYVAMFALTEDDLKKRILGCGDGPAAFNCTLTNRGGSIVSVDPIYRFSAEEIKNRINETYVQVMEQTEQNRHEFVWENISSPQELCELRIAAMNDFLSDYPAGLANGRYIDASLPNLPFADKTFELSLCSHLLFLYSEHLTADFHIMVIKELCRVAGEVRIFPLLELGAKKSRHLDTIINSLQNDSFTVNIRKVPYEFQNGGNEMLVAEANH